MPVPPALGAAPLPGQPHPLGAPVVPDGVNFSVYSRHAERVELLLYDPADTAQPARAIVLDAHPHRIWHYCHVFVPGLADGQVYAWRAHGVFDPAGGLPAQRSHDPRPQRPLGAQERGR